MRILFPAKLDAAPGAGYASNDRQVGQTGRILAPQMHYFRHALGHLTNNDSEARNLSFADFGLEVGFIAALPDLVQAL